MLTYNHLIAIANSAEACNAAYEWLLSQDKKTPQQIWRDCPEKDWRDWALFNICGIDWCEIRDRLNVAMMDRLLTLWQGEQPKEFAALRKALVEMVPLEDLEVAICDVSQLFPYEPNGLKRCIIDALSYTNSYTKYFSFLNHAALIITHQVYRDADALVREVYEQVFPWEEIERLAREAYPHVFA